LLITPDVFVKIPVLSLCFSIFVAKENLHRVTTNYLAKARTFASFDEHFESVWVVCWEVSPLSH